VFEMQGLLSFSSSVHQCGVQKGLLFPGVEGALNAGQWLPRGTVVGRQHSWQHTLLLRQWKLLDDETRSRCGFAARQVVSCSSGHDGPDFSCPLVPRIKRRRYRRAVVSWATSTSTLLPIVKEESSKVFAFSLLLSVSLHRSFSFLLHACEFRQRLTCTRCALP
jgi:hypothetical protein